MRWPKSEPSLTLRALDGEASLSGKKGTTAGWEEGTR